MSPVARGDSFRPSKGTTFWTSDFSVYNYLVRKKIHSELLEPGRSKNPPNWPGKGKPKRFIGTSLSHSRKRKRLTLNICVTSQSLTSRTFTHYSFPKRPARKKPPHPQEMLHEKRNFCRALSGYSAIGLSSHPHLGQFTTDEFQFQ